jgi:phosphoadenosine phosphosulfate reductase
MSSSASILVAEAIDGQAGALAELAKQLAALPAAERVAFGLKYLPAQHVLSSSFGAQAAVALHLVTQQAPQIPVVLIDTGYRFVDELSDSLRLNLRVHRANISPGWFEARYGRLWEQGLEGIERYNELTKLEPMTKALKELRTGTWISGLRRAQSSSRATLPVLEIRDGRFKLHPLYDWSDRDVGRYLTANDLPYHPLWERGYVSIGDWHTTRSLSEVSSIDETRFFGLKRECGLHGLDG